MKTITRIMVLFVLMGFIITCSHHNNVTKWPSRIVKSLWLPENARNVHRNVHAGVYQVFFEVSVPYPANGVINTMASSLTSQGWKRMKIDPLNKPHTLTATRGTFDLSSFIDDGNNVFYVYSWLEYWEKEGNIISYSFKYKVREGEQPQLLLGFASYIPVQRAKAAVGEVEDDCK